ncbi:MAG TPA: hypothetical protein VJ964_17190 [Balneolaceae bacterium]|nr:hypothetical protein [Balneolaceae bacterium]
MEDNTAKKITHEDLVFIKVSDRSQVYLPRLKSYDAIIIEYSYRLATMEIIKNIRCHNDEAIYLMPIFVYRLYGDSGSNHPLIDGMIQSLNNLDRVAEKTRKIQSRMKTQVNGR